MATNPINISPLSTSEKPSAVSGKTWGKSISTMSPQQLTAEKSSVESSSTLSTSDKPLSVSEKIITATPDLQILVEDLPVISSSTLNTSDKSLSISGLLVAPHPSIEDLRGESISTFCTSEQSLTNSVQTLAAPNPSNENLPGKSASTFSTSEKSLSSSGEIGLKENSLGSITSNEITTYPFQTDGSRVQATTGEIIDIIQECESSDSQTEIYSPDGRIIVIENIAIGDEHENEPAVSLDLPVAKLKTVIPSSNDFLDVKYVLQNDIRGKQIHDFYRKNKKLSTALQESLVDVILDHTFIRDVPSIAPVDEIEKMANEICSIFTSEDKTLYFIPSLNGRAPSGRLFNKYNSRLKKLRKQGLFPPSTKETNKRRKLEIEEEIESENCDDELQEYIGLIKSYDGSVEVHIHEIINVWNKTFDFRMKKFNRERNQDVLKEWPILQHPESYLLIEIDFEKMFGTVLKNKPTLQEAWNVVFSKSKIIFETLSNPACKDMLKRIKQYFNTDDTENERNVIFALALHGVFIPVLQSAGNGKVNKPSIPESQDSFLQLTTDVDFAGAVKERERTMLSLNINEHPFIAGMSIIKEKVTKTTKLKRYNQFIYDVRDVQRIKTFRVIYGSMVQFENENFLNALDFCFKIFKTFNITYPECEKTWQFLDQLFYGLGNETSSKIASVVNQLK